jgi:hypothetical protein
MCLPEHPLNLLGAVVEIEQQLFAGAEAGEDVEITAEIGEGDNDIALPA